MGFQFTEDCSQPYLPGREGERRSSREGNRSLDDIFGNGLFVYEHDLHVGHYLHPKVPLQSFCKFGTDRSIHPEISHSILLHLLDVLLNL